MGRYNVIAVALGFLLDLIFGDPVWLYHPVRIIGNLISWEEKVFRRLFPASKAGERVGGLCLCIFTVIISGGIPYLILYFLYQWNLYAGFIAAIICFYLLFAVKSLKSESMKVYERLKDDDIIGARKAVGMIVGRDTENLTKEGVSKAAVETIAENTADGVIAPMVYMLIGGVAGGFCYKAVNTMDSMIGYKNEKYKFFGTTAAKLDDVLNYIPSRLAALFMILASYILGFDGKNAWKIYKRDHRNHASPNSAQTESVAAGALDVRLAGNAVYFGKEVQKPTIGDEIRKVEAEDIVRMNRLLYGTSILAMIILGGIIFWGYGLL